MIEETNEKIEELRNVYTDSGELEKLRETELALRKAIQAQDLTEHYIIKGIVEDAKEDIANIDKVLSTDEKLNESENTFERKLLFRRKKWLKDEIIDRFSCEKEKNKIISIQKSIDAIYKRSAKYLKKHN